MKYSIFSLVDGLIWSLTLLLISNPRIVAGRVRSSKAAPPGRPSLNWDNYLLQPSFAADNVRSVIAPAGNNAYIHCKINHLADRAVTWIRKTDVQVLTVNMFTYTSDPRISAYSSSSGDEWVLKIVDARIDDTGGYECQVSTDPKMSLIFYLHVVVAYAKIEGQREVFMNSGGDLDLNCAVPRITNPPEYILWYNGSKIINYSNRKGVKILMSRRNKSSRLFMSNTRASDSGNYTCFPSNAKPASVIVHILQEETPAAMQHDRKGADSVNMADNCQSRAFNLLTQLLIFFFVNNVIKWLSGPGHSIDFISSGSSSVLDSHLRTFSTVS